MEKIQRKLSVLTVFLIIGSIWFSPKTEAQTFEEVDIREFITAHNARAEEDWGRFNPSEWLFRQFNSLDDEPVLNLRIPVLMGVRVSHLWDGWHEPRPGRRLHEGNDMMAPRGAFVVSPTEAIVSSVGYGRVGGNYVFTINPGGERFYYAHLDRVAENLSVGQRLKVGDLIGYVGNTGNAITTPTHLHFGIYKNGALNPFPRLTQEFTTEERLDALNRVIANSPTPNQLALSIVRQNRKFFDDVSARRIDMPEPLRLAYEAASSTIANVPKPTQIPGSNLRIGSRGQAVASLQSILIHSGRGPAADTLRRVGPTGFFGTITRNALREFQRTVGIAPASGYYGPLTRSYMKVTGVL